MYQDVVDEVLSDLPLYTIRDKNGNVLNDDVDIALKTPVTQEGTPINREFLKNLQGDLYSSNGYNTLVADKIETELDLSKISSYTSPPSVSVHQVAYGNNMWIAVAGSGKILKSTDNKTWTSVTSGTSENFYYVLYDGTQFVAITMKYGYVYSSSDGETWTRKSTITSSSVYVRGFDYKDGVYVVTTDTPNIRTSTDLVNWTVRLTPSTTLLSVTHNDDGFIAVGYNGLVYFSTNGTSWTARNAISGSPTFDCVKWVKDRFIAHSNGALYNSRDNGVSWGVAAKQAITGNITNMYHDGVKYIASGYQGFRYSYDGSSWKDIVVYSGSTDITYSYFYEGKIYCFISTSSSTTFKIIQTTKAYKAYFKLSTPLSSYVTGKILRIKTVSNGGKSDFQGLNYLNVNNLGEKPINSIFKSNEYLDLMYTGSGWNVIGPRFVYGQKSITSRGTQYIPFGFSAKVVFAYCHRTGSPSNDGNSMGFIPLQYNTETLLEVYPNGPIRIYGILQAYDTLTIKADSLSENCVVDYFAIAW